MTDFNDLVDTDGLDPREEARLRRAHDLLVQVGPPPDLPPALEAPPTEMAEAEIIQFPLLPKRRWAIAAIAAATLALLTFIGGYFYGNSKSQPSAFSTTRVVAMHGPGQARRRAEDLLAGLGGQLADGDGRRAPAAAGEPDLVLRALADEERQGSRSVRHLPGSWTQDDRAVQRAVQPEALRRLGRHDASRGDDEPGQADRSST